MFMIYFLALSISLACLADTNSVADHVRELQKPATSDLLTIAKSLLEPFRVAEPKTTDSTEYQTAYRLFEAGNDEQAQSMLKKLVRQKTHLFQTQYILGAIALKQNDLAEARKRFGSIVKTTVRNQADQEIKYLAQKALALMALSENQETQALAWLRKIPNTEEEQAQIYDNLQQYTPALSLLEGFKTRLEQNPDSWIQKQLPFKELAAQQNQLATSERSLKTAEQDYDTLKQKVLLALTQVETQAQKLLHPKVEIPLTGALKTKVLLDQTLVFSEEKSSSNEMLTISMSYGQHTLEFNHLVYWVNVYLSPNGQVMFDFMEKKAGSTLPKPDLANVSKLQALLSNIEQIKQELLTHQEPIFSETHNSLQKEQESNQEQRQRVKQELEIALKEKLALINLEIQLIKTKQIGLEINKIEKRKKVHLDRIK